MSTSANTENVVIVQHTSPQNVQSQEEQGKNIPANMPKPLQKFFQGEPEVLGVTQLFIGINQIFFGIILTTACRRTHCYALDILVYTGVLFWPGIMYIISGSLSIAASHKTSLGKVKASLVLHIIGCIVAVISTIIVAIFCAHITGFYYSYNNNYCAYYKQSQTCEGEFLPRVIYRGIGSIILLLTVLQFCITLSTSIFGCKTACRTSYNEVTVVIYQTAPGSDSKPALSSDGEVQMP